MLEAIEAVTGVPAPLLFGQLLLGLINGAFYAMLSLGLAVIFGLLNIINFAHGAQFMMGAFAAWMLLEWTGLGYWWALLLAPLAVGATGVVIERTMISWLYKLDHLYGLLLTFGLALVIEGVFRNEFGSSGLPYRIPPELSGAWDLGDPQALSAIETEIARQSAMLGYLDSFWFFTLTALAVLPLVLLVRLRPSTTGGR